MVRTVMPHGIEKGMSLLEVMVAIVLGILVLSFAGTLFLVQVKGFQDLNNQSRIQAGIKKSMQVMTRDIASTGGFLSDPREAFSPGRKRVQFAFADLNGKYCGAGVPVTMAFYSRQGKQEDSLYQQIRCFGAAARNRLLMTASGKVELEFEYLDKFQKPTTSVLSVRAVKYSLRVKSKKDGGLNAHEWGQDVTVQCLNL